MVSIVLFISLTIFSIGSYIVWPSRYNVVNHLSIGFVFIAYFVPLFILNVQDNTPPDIVDLFYKIMVLGAVAYVAGLFIGFSVNPKKTKYSFEVLSQIDYERYAIKLTRTFLIAGIAGISISYMAMGFVPMFAADPLAAKFFRGEYQAPYLRVAIIYRTAFTVLQNMIPIGIMIWYKYRSPFIFTLVIASIVLIFVSLARNSAFSGLLLAIAIIMSFKSKASFRLLLILIISSYLLSSVFYYFIGVSEITQTKYSTDNSVFWSTVSSGTNDINEQFDFLSKFNENPRWTYGRNILGSFIPGHYEWNPSSYTLIVIANGDSGDINDIVSGGIRLPLAIWGYVAFSWYGVVAFCMFSGVVFGYFLKYTKVWLQKYDSMITRVIILSLNITIFTSLSVFYSISIYYIMPSILLLFFYVRRFKFSLY